MKYVTCHTWMVLNIESGERIVGGIIMLVSCRDMEG